MSGRRGASPPALAAVERLRRAVAAPRLTAAGLAAAVGDDVADRGDALQVDVRPRDAAFAAARVVRRPEDGAPDHLRLVLAPDAGLTVGDLRRAFGTPGVFPARPGAGDLLVFDPDPPDAPIACAVLVLPGGGAAPVGPGGADDRRPVRELTLRRDVRAPEAD